MILKVLFFVVFCLASSQFVQAAGDLPANEPAETFLSKAARFGRPEDVCAIAADCDQLIELWNNFATGAFIRWEAPLGDDMQVGYACKIFIQNFIELHIKITDALLVLPKKLWRDDDVLYSFACSYVEELCPVLCEKVLNRFFPDYKHSPVEEGCPAFCKKVLNRFFPDRTHSPIVFQVALLHYITCRILYAGVPVMLLTERKERSFITLADGLAPFRSEDGELKTPEDFKAAYEALDLKKYFEHWYGNAAFVEPAAGGGEGAAVGDVEEAGDVPGRATDTDAPVIGDLPARRGCCKIV